MSNPAEMAYVQDRQEGKTSILYTLNLLTGKVTKIGEISFNVADISLLSL
ncbi:MAG: hypothetical protein AAFO04_11345 [Cyanobacteria bacterium J06592_8]